MPQFAAGQLKLESGVLGSSSMATVQLVTNVRAGFNISRVNVNALNRGKPLEQRPVMNYVSVEGSFDYIKRDNMVEQCVGLINTTGVAALLFDAKPTTATYGIRSAQVYYAPTNSASYNGLLDLKSGVLTSYSLQGSVNDPVRASIGFQFLDMSGSVNTTARDSTNYTAGIIRPEGQLLTGFTSATSLQLTGFGLTGVTVQSFSFSIGINRASVMQLGQRFPVDRPLTDVNASLQIQGFFEGINNSFTGLGMYQCGYPAYGTVALTMNPACATYSPSTVTMGNPYFDSLSVDSQVGGFSTFSMSFSLPLGPNPLETGDGSTLTLT